MPTTITEVRGQTGDSRRTERRFIISGSSSIVTVRSDIITKLTTDDELIFAGKEFRDVDLDEVNVGVWEARVLYQNLENSGGEGSDSTSGLSFDTMGGMRKITRGIDERRSTGAPDARKLIGINADGTVEGVEGPARAFNFEVRRTIPHDQVTSAYVSALYAGSGTINNATFDIFAAQELLFLGCRGSRTGYGPWDFSFAFSAIPNPGTITVAGLSGSITLADVKGWDAIWTWNLPRKITYNSTDIIIPVPEALYANRVFDTYDFSLLNVT